jgi:uncharacterized membrane protein
VGESTGFTNSPHADRGDVSGVFVLADSTSLSTFSCVLRLQNIWWVARGALAVHGAFAAITWFTLPSRIPTHFGPSGAPDAWSARTLLGWFMFVGVSLFLHGLIYVITLPGARDTWNIPEKDRFLKLTPEQQQPICKLMRIFGGISSLCLTLTMLTLQIGMYLTARGITQGLPWYINVAMFVPIVCMLIAMIPWSKAVKHAIVHPFP